MVAAPGVSREGIYRIVHDNNTEVATIFTPYLRETCIMQQARMRRHVVPLRRAIRKGALRFVTVNPGVIFMTVLERLADSMSKGREPSCVRGEARRPGLARPRGRLSSGATPNFPPPASASPDETPGRRRPDSCCVRRDRDRRARRRPCALDTPAERMRAERPNPSGPLRASLQPRDRTVPPASRAAVSRAVAPAGYAGPGTTLRAALTSTKLRHESRQARCSTRSGAPSRAGAASPSRQGVTNDA